jgi:uncharacterized protein (DUF1501 family)
MALSRRNFLKTTGLGFLASGLPPAFLVRAAQAPMEKRGRVLVVIFQRGGMDGLNAVIPFTERSYYAARPSIAVPEPGSAEDRSIDLNGFYALHPALASLKPLFARGNLAVVHAAGSPDNTRSHFDAQDYMELGTPGIKSTPDGWLNRHLAEVPSNLSPVRAVALSSRLPRILHGPARCLTMASTEEIRLRDESLLQAMQSLYLDSTDPLFRTAGANLFDAMQTLSKIDRPRRGSGGPYPASRFGRALMEIARLIKADVGLEIAFAEIDGWDTHVNQGGATGQMSNRLRDLADGLAGFFRDLDGRMEDVALLTMSEFGRTVKENGNRGTDHGHANVMFVLGGKVNGGKVYGRWPGLDPERLHEGRDLALTTDFRAVCGEVLQRHMGQKALGKVFPGFPLPPESLGLIA